VRIVSDQFCETATFGFRGWRRKFNTHKGTFMRFFRLLSDWAFTRIFWLCLLGSTAQADVILWDAPFTGNMALTAVAGGEIRSQAIDMTTAATAKSITLSLGQPWWLAGTGGPSQISLWLDSTPAERRTLIYSGAFRSSWSGLAVDLPEGRSFLSLENLAGSRTINWNQQVIDGVTGSFMGQITGTPVPEPGAVVLLLVCCAAGIFYAWRGRRGE
jgi:hypothetical protein